MNSDDPFRRLFDEDFVAGARHREPSAEERIAAARRRSDPAAERSGTNRRRRRPRRPRRRRSLPGAVAVLVPFVVVILAAALVDRFGGPEPDVFAREDVLVLDGEVTRLPPPDPDERETRLLREPDPVEGEGADDYELVGRDPGSGRPLRYNPCRPIAIVHSGTDLVPDGLDLIRRAVDRVSAETGLVFRIEGPTSETPDVDRSPIQDRYGDRWAPVHVAFTDEETVPALAGEVAGIGGSQRVSRDGRSGFVTGIVFLDTDSFLGIADLPDGEALMESIVLHEFGHLVGLHHVDDPDLVMYERSTGTTALGVGDRAGLARVGSGGCLPGL